MKHLKPFGEPNNDGIVDPSAMRWNMEKWRHYQRTVPKEQRPKTDMYGPLTMHRYIDEVTGSSACSGSICA